MYLTTPTADYFIATIQTIKDSSNAIANQDFVTVQKYQYVNPFTLNSIYLLTREAAATNSLYIVFTVITGGASNHSHYFEFEFDNLGLSSFNIDNGK